MNDMKSFSASPAQWRGMRGLYDIQPVRTKKVTAIAPPPPQFINFSQKERCDVQGRMTVLDAAAFDSTTCLSEILPTVASPAKADDVRRSGPTSPISRLFHQPGCVATTLDFWKSRQDRSILVYC